MNDLPLVSDVAEKCDVGEKCFECGKPAAQNHHVVPKSKGGKKTVPLCLECHGKVHDLQCTDSELTRTALAAAKARGIKLGSARPNHWKGREHRRLVGVRHATRAAAKAHTVAREKAYVDLLPLIMQLKQEGATLRTIATRLNELGHRTRRGRLWGSGQVYRVLRYAGMR